MPTLVGALFFIFAIRFYFQPPEKLLGLTIFAALFGGSSMISTAAFTIQPFYFVGLVFIFQTFWRSFGRREAPVFFKGKGWMYAFGVVAIVSAIILPRLFAGIPVYDPYVGIDEGIDYRPLLHPALANFTQIGYLLIDIGVVVCAAKIKTINNTVSRFYQFTFYFLFGVVLLQYICGIFHIPFPYFIFITKGDILLQNQSFGLRYPGTFTEPSGAGTVLACFAGGYLAQFARFGKALKHMIVAFIGIFLVQSSSSIFAFAAVFGLLIVTTNPLSQNGEIDLRRVKRNLGFLLIVLFGVGGLLLSPLRDSILRQTISKQDSSSYINRSASDSYAIDLFFETRGLGVGMGSNRPSSLLASLLSTVGLVGFLLFIGMVVALVMNTRREQVWLRWAALALFIDASLGAPDYVQPWNWAFLAFLIHQSMTAKRRQVLSVDLSAHHEHLPVPKSLAANTGDATAKLLGS